MGKHNEQFKLNQIRNTFSHLNNVNEMYEILNYEFKDDCSYIKLPNDDLLVISSDFIRGEHFNMFESKHMDYFDLGYFLVIANLSDIASSGAQPLGISTIVRYTHAMSDDDFQAILNGIKTACEEYGLDVLGGDTGSYKESVLAATITGVLTKITPMLRTNAKVGDSVFISGIVGLAITSMVYFLYAKERGLNLEASEEAILLEQWQKPKAFVELGILLSQNHLSICCQDISDGLKASIEQIADASDVSIELEQSKIPLSNITRKVADFLDIDPYKLAFSISADFNLLFTVSQDKIDSLKKIMDSNSIECFEIGRVIDKSSNTFITGHDVEELPGIKWQHQSGDFIEDVVKNAKL
jgi:thiamine-monophosphate kinase